MLNKRTSPIQNRRIETQYPVGPVTDPLSGEVGTRVVEITTLHDKVTKMFTTVITWRDLFKDFTTWQSNYPYVTLDMNRVQRYAQNTLALQHIRACDRFEASDFSTFTYYPRGSAADSGQLEMLRALVTAANPAAPPAPDGDAILDQIEDILYPLDETRGHQWNGGDVCDALAELLRTYRPNAELRQAEDD